MTFTLDDFDYFLPPDRIAQVAVSPRDASRLLVIDRAGAALQHRIFRDVVDYLRPGDVLALNRTRVIPARLHARRIPTGGALEILLVEKMGETRWLAMVGGKRAAIGEKMAINGADLTAEVVEEREEALRVIDFSGPVEPVFDAIGEMPLPPYIHGKLEDPERYQTVYAQIPGSVAAPTAGLHFTPDLLLRIREMGVQLAYCTLHVGPGTFLPVKPGQIESRRLHSEWAELRPEDARILNDAKLAGGRIVCVGTTTTRTLETAALYALGTPPDQINQAGYAEADVCPWKPISAFAAPTDLFIMPGFRFRATDALITNFHLPKSTLLMLVCAFAGRDQVLAAYAAAIQEGYRFYSLGDACLFL
jgi:S-adenosylmethionine:tRNA ribosyltransferase-isomerase